VKAVLEPTGKLVVYSASMVSVWDSGSAVSVSSKALLLLGDDGILKIFDTVNFKVVWSSTLSMAPGWTCRKLNLT
jgi:hypothetical protein